MLTPEQLYAEHNKIAQALVRWFQSQEIDLHTSIGVMLHLAGVALARSSKSKAAFELNLRASAEYFSETAKEHFAKEHT